MDQQHKYYRYREISLDEFKRLDSLLKEQAGAQLFPGEIRPTKLNPAFNDQFGFRSWAEFERFYDKNAGSIRKYSFVVYPKDTTEWERRYGMLEVRISEFARAEWSASHYPSIQLLNWRADELHVNRVFALIRDELGLELTADQTLSDLKEEVANSIRRPEIQQIASSAIRSGNFDLAITGVIQLVETRLRQRCIECGNEDAINQTGIDLAKCAFHEETCCLVPPIPVASTARHGAFLLFQGFFLYLRNAFAHNQEVIKTDSELIVPILQLCDFLLTIIDKSQCRRNP